MPMRGTIAFLATPDRGLDVAEGSIRELDVGPRDHLDEFCVPDHRRPRDTDENFVQRGGAVCPATIYPRIILITPPSDLEKKNRRTDLGKCIRSGFRRSCYPSRRLFPVRDGG